MSDVAITVHNLTKTYKLYTSPKDRLKEALHPLRKVYHNDFDALRDVSFEIKRGETVGIIGQNGAGKSTLLKLITGVIAPTSGTVVVNGRISALLELGAGFDPQISGLENVYFNGTIQGFSKEEMDAKLDSILAFADIGEFIHQPVRTYSSGMFVRLAFALAVHVEPEILIIDEALAVGDMMFEAKCYERIKTLMSGGVTTLFVTHNMNTISTLCSRVYMLDGGSIYTAGTPKDVTFAYYRLQREREHARRGNKALFNAKSEKKDWHSCAKSEVQPGEERFGNGAAQIVDFVIIDHDGLETEALQTGKPFVVIMSVVFYETVNNPCFGMMVRNLQGQNLLGIHSYHDRRMFFGEKVAGSALKIRFEGDLLINPGKYTISLSISDHVTDLEYTNIDARRNVIGFTIYGKEFSYGLINCGGLVLVENVN